LKISNAKSPLRIGFAGGGTDVAPFCDTYGGQVLNSTISLYSYCRIEETLDGKIHLEAVDFEESEIISLTNKILINDKKNLTLSKLVYNRMIKDYNNNRPLSIKIITSCDVPPGSGVGSSSSVVVAIITAFFKFLNLKFNKSEIAELAFIIEREDGKFLGGKQDQYASVYGGFNFMEFTTQKTVKINPLIISDEFTSDLSSQLLLYYTNRSRESSKIIEEQIESSKNKNSPSIKAMINVKSLAKTMKDAMENHDIDSVFKNLSLSWENKKNMSKSISNREIDIVANQAIKSGAKAIKISGAGGGGFMLIGVSLKNRWKVINKLTKEFGGKFYLFIFDKEGARSW